jgi:hypothetical protein
VGLRVKITTKFDCTATGVTGHFRDGNQAQWNRRRNQQRNYETLTQIIGLYTQPQNLSLPVYDSDQGTWSFEFETEFEGIFRTGTDELGVLKQSCIGTPMITGLDEKDNLLPTLVPEQNIWFEIS